MTSNQRLATSNAPVIAGTPRPGGGAELWWWVFMRVSGVALLFLALGHLAIMHMINTVDQVNYEFVAQRYGRSFSLWRWYDLAMLALAMLHGLNGARILIDDYVQPVRWRRLSIAVLQVAGAALLVLGAVVILTFRPVHGA